MKWAQVYSRTMTAALLMAGMLSPGAGPASAADARKTMSPAPMRVDKRHEGMTLDARVGQYILIGLEDPWGGAYGWEMADISPDRMLKSIGRSEHAPKGWCPDGQDTGRPDTAFFRLRAVGEGQVTVTLACVPPPWLTVPVWRYQVTFNVRP